MLLFLVVWWCVGIVLIPLSEWKHNGWKKPIVLKTAGDWMYALLVSCGSWLTIVWALFHYEKYN